jgi:hypothetical protein
MNEPAQLRELAARVRRLSPSHWDPERFHFEKDELARALVRLARRAEGRA